MGLVRLTLVDGDSKRRAAICHCLSGAGIHVEPYEDAREVVRRWPDEQVLLVHDDEEVVATLVDAMRRGASWLPIVAFAEAPPPQRVVRAVQAGVTDYLAWPFPIQDLCDATAKAEHFAQGHATVTMRQTRARSRIERLTRREREVLEEVANGLSNRAIAAKLAISARTVEIHRANLLTKLEASHTSQAIRIAIEASLLN